MSIITNLAGITYKMIIAPGSQHDFSAIKAFDPQIFPEGSTYMVMQLITIMNTKII